MGHVHTRAAAVIRLIDAVTERAVQHGGVQLQTVQQHKVIWKDTDCAVILEQGRPAVRSYIGSTADDPDRGRRIDLLISGKYYQEVRLHIDRTADAAPAVYPVWLQPSRQYPFQLYSSQKDITVIQGVHDPAEVLYVLWPAEGDRYKLAETTGGEPYASLCGVRTESRMDGHSCSVRAVIRKSLSRSPDRHRMAHICMIPGSRYGMYFTGAGQRCTKPCVFIWTTAEIFIRHSGGGQTGRSCSGAAGRRQALRMFHFLPAFRLCRNCSGTVQALLCVLLYFCRSMLFMISL